MPTYQYACETCGHRFDIRQRFSDSALTTCPQCGGHIHRVINPVGIIFKGPGFYVTDNKNGSKNFTNGNGSAKKTETNGTDKTPAKTETKTTPAAGNSNNK